MQTHRGQTREPSQGPGGTRLRAGSGSLPTLWPSADSLVQTTIRSPPQEPGVHAISISRITEGPRQATAISTPNDSVVSSVNHPSVGGKPPLDEHRKAIVTSGSWDSTLVLTVTRSRCQRCLLLPSHTDHPLLITGKDGPPSRHGRVATTLDPRDASWVT